MPRAISKPGPRPTSCITCRRRRKKCDLSRPSCQRCLKGGHECLGYEDAKPRAKVHHEGPISPIVPVVPADTARSKTLAELPNEQQAPTGTNTDYESRPSVLAAALRHRMSAPSPSAIDDRTLIDSSKDYDRLWPQEQSRLTQYSRWRAPQSSRDERGLDISDKNNLPGATRALCQSIPRSVDTTKMINEGVSLRIISDYYVYRVRSWFMTPPAPIRGRLMTRFLESKAIIWTMYLGTKLLQAVSENPCSPAVQGCIGRIDNLEQKVNRNSYGTISFNCAANRIMVQLELAFLKLTIVDTASGYAALQKALPWFLQLVATDINLYVDDSKGNLTVSFPGVISATQHELQRFVIYDTAAALILGVPPLVEYEYGTECNHSPYGFEWVHGIPVVIVEAISQINSWRASSRGSPMDWEALETRISTWTSPFVGPGEASDTGTADMARFAVQESWKHVVLIYIYMGICGVSSHDSRVQTSVHRIIELGETMVNLPLGTHMFAHCIVVGLAARLEKHRVLVHKMLVSFKVSRVWLFQGPEFSQVLYHLWHGVGEGGAPVTWDDYVQSRCAIMSI